MPTNTSAFGNDLAASKEQLADDRLRGCLVYTFSHSVIDVIHLDVKYSNESLIV
jgi:hypothetical protein